MKIKGNISGGNGGNGGNGGRGGDVNLVDKSRKNIKISIGAFVIVGVIIAAVAFWTNSGGGLPDGTYEPVAVTYPGMGRISDNMGAYGSYAIVIKGNTFAFKVSGVSTSARYTYKDGTITITGLGQSMGLDIEYKDGVLYWTLSGDIVIELAKT